MKKYSLNIKRRLFRKPIVYVEVVARYPVGLPSSLAGTVFRYPADIHDIPDIQARLEDSE